ncbi:MAG: endonuclease/exonuclease/phosphatase family protein [Flavobacteriaceae bacterium]
MKKRKFWFQITVLLNLSLLILQLLAMGSIGSWSLIPLLSLGVPLLFILNLLFFFYWLIRFRWPLLLFLIVCGICFQELNLLYQFKDNGIPTTKGLHVMSFNVRSFNRFKWLKNKDVSNSIAQFIEEENPDLICFQEYGMQSAPNFKNYPYHFSKPYNLNGQIGTSIFSKFPLINANSIRFKDSRNGGMYVDLLWKKDTLRVYNIHFESLRLDTSDTLLTPQYSEKFRFKINTVFESQKRQIKQFNALSSQTQYPEIICTDLNNNAFSESYRLLVQGRKDGFTEKGKGFGATYQFPYVPMRIDFIITHSKFQVIDFKTHRVELSDHKPISSYLQWP